MHIKRLLVKEVFVLLLSVLEVHSFCLSQQKITKQYINKTNNRKINWYDFFVLDCIVKAIDKHSAAKIFWYCGNRRLPIIKPAMQKWKLWLYLTLSFLNELNNYIYLLRVSIIERYLEFINQWNDEKSSKLWLSIWFIFI